MNRQREFTIRLTSPPLKAEHLGTDKSAEFSVDLPGYVSLQNMECALLQCYVSSPDPPEELSFRVFHPEVKEWEQMDVTYEGSMEKLMKQMDHLLLGLFMVTEENKEEGLYCLHMLNYGTKLRLNNRMSRLFGFTTHDGEKEKTFFKPKAEFSSVWLIECSNLVSNLTIFNNIQKPILGAYPSVATGLHSEPLSYFPVSTNTTNRLFFRILDEDGNTVTFSRRKIYLYLSFRQSFFIHP